MARMDANEMKGSEHEQGAQAVQTARLLESFRDRCRGAGIADTQQRRVIYEVLAASNDHPTAEAVYERVKRRLPRLSLATVYRNLRLFVEAGLIEEVATALSFARFDANPGKHHHLICTSCHRVGDYYSDEFDALAGGKGSMDGFEVHDVKVSVYGLCPTCRKTAGSTEQQTSTRTDAAAADVHNP